MTNASNSNPVNPISLVLRAIGAFAIVAGSFWTTIKVLDDFFSTPEQKPELFSATVLQPTSWQTSGGASYQIHDDTVTMQGPGQIYNLLVCAAPTSSVDFSIFVEGVGITNMQIMFVGALGVPVGDAVIQTLNAEVKGKVTVSGNTPAGTKMVRALVYSPKEGQAVVFKDPVIRCTPAQ